jgi:hypothetical protein
MSVISTRLAIEREASPQKATTKQDKFISILHLLKEYNTSNTSTVLYTPTGISPEKANPANNRDVERESDQTSPSPSALSIPIYHPWTCRS